MNDILNDFAAALKSAGVAEFFEAYPSSHKREHLRVIAEAKKPETRARRIESAVKMIASKAAAKRKSLGYSPRAVRYRAR